MSFRGILWLIHIMLDFFWGKICYLLCACGFLIWFLTLFSYEFNYLIFFFLLFFCSCCSCCCCFMLINCCFVFQFRQRVDMMSEFDALSGLSTISNLIGQHHPNPNPNPVLVPLKKKRNLPGTPGKPNTLFLLCFLLCSCFGLVFLSLNGFFFSYHNWVWRVRGNQWYSVIESFNYRLIFLIIVRC